MSSRNDPDGGKYLAEEYDIRLDETLDLLREVFDKPVRLENPDELGFLELEKISSDCRKIITSKRLLNERVNALLNR